ncbi:MAG: hypothetical protein GY854_29820 [Deltaproteobacteria bacterium]|nr:hypothetical protein [Deltaproteobacteria bacterium]
MPKHYDRPKRSWREVDQMKDGSKHHQSNRSKMPAHKQARADSASKVYKSKLDAFFDGDGKAPQHVKEKLSALDDTSKGGKERAAALKAIKEAGTSSATDSAVTAYLEKWELPPDFDVLAEVLSCSDEEYLETAIDMLEEMLGDNRVPRRTQVLEQRLRRVKNLADDPDLGDKAAALIRVLRRFGIKK